MQGGVQYGPFADNVKGLSPSGQEFRDEIFNVRGVVAEFLVSVNHEFAAFLDGVIPHQSRTSNSLDSISIFGPLLLSAFFLLFLSIFLSTPNSLTLPSTPHAVEPAFTPLVEIGNHHPHCHDTSLHSPRNATLTSPLLPHNSILTSVYPLVQFSMRYTR